MKKSDDRVKRTKFVALALAAVMLCSLFSGCGGRNVGALTGTVKIASFPEDCVSAITVKQGAAAEEIGLPDVLTANIIVVVEPDTMATAEPLGEPGADPTVTVEPSAEPLQMQPAETTQPDEAQAQAVETTELRDVPVSWECADYDPDTIGAYVFTAKLQPGYAYEEELPTVTVTVQAAEPNPSDAAEPIAERAPEASAEPTASGEPIGTDEPQACAVACFTNEPIAIEVERGTAIADIPLPEKLSALHENGDAIEVPVTWTNETENTSEYESEPNDYESGSLYGYGPLDIYSIC